MILVEVRNMPYALIQNMYDSLSAEKQKEVYDFICFLASASSGSTDESLEDREDYEAAAAAWEEYEKSGRKGILAEDLYKELGL